MHLRWERVGPATVVEATLEVVVPPAVPALYFWALQVSFTDGRRHLGAAHLGLQWHPDHPGATAVNWGGYAAGGGELRGTSSSWPSATGNPNTRDLAWEPGRSYVLRVRPGDEAGQWVGEVDGLGVVRELFGGGHLLEDPLVWSEVFARCDDPSSTVRWTRLRADGQPCSAVRTSYQSWADGGCTNTTSIGDGDGVLQVTSTSRLVGDGETIRLSPGGS